jgi:hypothetical protein
MECYHHSRFEAADHDNAVRDWGCESPITGDEGQHSFYFDGEFCCSIYHAAH